MRSSLLLIIRAHLFIGLLLSTWQLFACESISIISSSSHYSMVHRIEAALFEYPKVRTPVQHLLVEKMTAAAYQETLSKSCLVVTVGSEALDAVLENNVKLPVLSILTRKSVFEYILRQHSRSLDDQKRPMAVVYLDQPLYRQFNLIATLFKDRAPPRMGVLLSARSASEQNPLQEQAKQKNMPLTTLFVKKFENPISVLDAILNEVDVVLALPDPRIYHSTTARGILLTAFHKRIPIVGYSHTFVNNGALASVYSDTKQIASQTAKTIAAIIQHSMATIPKEQYPNDYSIAINYQVAKSLGMSVCDQNAIKSIMDKIEGTS